ncbi:hypothetical protein Plec18167_007172 [Paecilomyces lecythidis]|uniref:Methyltransferase n=1 Tax=Paecilomyces lecythidis TaxID=3004212 RepID=A0ABR3X5P3_9EURO
MSGDNLRPRENEVRDDDGPVIEIEPESNGEEGELPLEEETSPEYSSISESESDDEDSTSIRSTRSFHKDTIEDVFENGRRYCNDTYFMPNDEAEQTRLNIAHQIYLIVLEGELTRVPIPRGRTRILDIGTGPGDWAVEMGERYPDSEIVATDISVFDIGPSSLGLPNVSFQLDDAEAEWTYHEPFDLIHLRSLSGAFRDWGSVYRQAFNHLRPGGYIEVIDADTAADVINFPNIRNSYFSILVAAMQSAAEETGYPRNQDHLRPALLTSVGFTAVNSTDITIPVGVWPEDPRQKTLGKMALISILEGLEAWSLRQLTETGNWTAEEVRALCDKVKGELVKATGMTARVRILTGRRPYAHDFRRGRSDDEMLEEVLARLQMREQKG